MPAEPVRRAFPISPEQVRETKVTVKIPRPLYRKIQLVVDGSGFNSPTDFIVYVLRDLMGEAPEREPDHRDPDQSVEVRHEVAPGAPHARDFTQEELDDVKRKLKNLGYL